MSASKSISVFKLFKIIFLFPIAFVFSAISTIVIFIAAPICLVPIIPYKYLVVALSKFALPEAVKILKGTDNLMASGSVYKTANMYVLIPQIFEGRLELDKVLLEIQMRVIDKRRADGTLQFEELKYYIKTFLGFSFFMPDKSFDLKNHVKIYNNNNEIVNQKKFNKIREELSQTLFARKRSPWEIVILNNYRRSQDDKEHSVLFWKIHHAMGDGNTTAHIIFSTFGKLSPLHIPQFGKTFKEKLYITCSAYLNFFLLIANFPFDFIYNPKRIFDLNPWQKVINPKNLRYVMWSPETIDSNVLKEISVSNKSSISAVLISLGIGCFRRLMEAKGIRTPKTIRCFFAHNLANPSDGLACNSLTSYFHVTIKESTTVTMPQTVNRELITALAIGHKILGPLLSVIYNYAPASWSFRRSFRNSFATFGFTSFPMPSLDVQMADCKLVEQYCNVELIETSTVISLYCLKYKNKFHLTYAIQRKLLKDEEEIYELEKYFNEELELLKINNNIV